MCNHAWLTIYPTVGAAGDPRGLLGAATDWMAYGHFAVVAFIVLSGYSLAISTREHPVADGVFTFLRRRFIRLVVPYWAALLLSLALSLTVVARTTGTHWDSALPVTGTGIVLHALLLQDVADSGQINHALWSIAIEWHLYFLFPLLLLLRRRLGPARATAGVVALGFAVSSFFNGGLTIWTETNLLGCFALGIAARELAVRADRFPWRCVLAGLAVLIGLIVWQRGTQRAAEGTNTVLEPLVGLLVAVLLIVLSQPGESRLRSVLDGRLLVFVGTISYSIYLLHAPLLQLIWQYGMEPTGLPLHDGRALAVLLAAGLPAAVGVGYAFFMLVERHCLGRRPQEADSRPTVTGQPGQAP